MALINPLDMYEPVTASASGVDFQRMLWIRGESSGSARVSLSSEYGTLQKSLDRAVKALNIVLQAEAGGFGLVVLNLGEVAAQTIKRLPYTTWLRLSPRHRGQRNGVCPDWQRAHRAEQRGSRQVQLASGFRLQAPGLNARVIRARKVESDQYVRVPLSAAAC